MPYAAPRICARCRKGYSGQRCPCRPAWEGSDYPADDARMKGLRRAKLRANPLCERTRCRHPSVTVDHIVPLAEGGARYEWANLQALCRAHHTEKTTRDALRGKTRLR